MIIRTRSLPVSDSIAAVTCWNSSNRGLDQIAMKSIASFTWSASLLLLIISSCCWSSLLLFSSTAILASIQTAAATESSIVSRNSENKIDAVVLTTGKDTRVFERSIQSALTHLLDVDKFYIICPKADDLKLRLSAKLGPRIVFVDESSFPFNAEAVADVMLNTVKQRGNYPVDGKSPFEKTLWSKLGWFLQQVLKLTAGTVLKLRDHVLLDSDVVWYNDIRFLNHTSAITSPSPLGAVGELVTRYNYVSSSQYHPAYIAILKRISGVDLLKNQPYHRSGVSHHMVISSMVMSHLVNHSEALHGGLPFWQVVLNQSAQELTCHAPRLAICGGGSTLSEYELYFNYARSKFPETVAHRPLMWANGPSPGLLFWPKSLEKLESDGSRNNWLSHRQKDVEEALTRQMAADKAQGFDYVGYHNYAKRRYFELVGADYELLCVGKATPVNSTCSWHGFTGSVNLDGTVGTAATKAVQEQKTAGNPRTVESWFAGCACYMCAHPSY